MKRFGASFNSKKTEKVKFYFSSGFEIGCVVVPRNILTPRPCQLIANYLIKLIASPKPFRGDKG